MAFCGIDVGTQGVRAAVVDESGRLLGAGSAALAGSRRDGALHEQLPERWWAALTAAVRDAVARAEGDDVDAIALDATSGTVLVESADGTPRGAALMYDDARAHEQAVRAQEVGGAVWSALGYRMQPSWALPKVLWLVEHGSLGREDRVVHQSDHLVGRLTGHPVATDTSNALKTGADLRTATWPGEVFAELKIRKGLLPALVLPGEVLGRVGSAAAGALGLRQGTPVRAGMTDGCAAQIAAGALSAGSWSSALGTTLVVKGSTAQPVRDPNGAVYCHRHPDGGWLPGGASSTGAGVIEKTFAGADLEALTRAARRLVPVAGVTYPLAGSGERFPFVAPDARGFTADGIDDDATRFAALCQGVAYVERLAYDVLAVLGADTSGTVAFTGGATRNPWWNQLRTDMLGRTTLLPESSQAAVGMAILAAAEPGQLTATAKRMVRVGARLEPDAEVGTALRPGYQCLVAELADRGWLDRVLADAVLSAGTVSR